MIQHFLRILTVAAVLNTFSCLYAQPNAPNFPGGIVVDGDGLISAARRQPSNPSLEQRRLKLFAGQHLNQDLNAVSKFRCVSLKQVDLQLKEALDAGKKPSFELQHLAGLTSIEFVLLDHDKNDVVIVGPAEGFAKSSAGRVIGTETGRPTLMLDDLLVVMRLNSDQQRLGCSFDPEPTRLAQANAWSSANDSPSSVIVAKQRFIRMADILGTWNVSVFGIPSDCHAALTAVEADFDLKRLALGTSRPAIRRFYSHLHYARPGENSMRRWWLAPRYNVIERSDNEDVFRLSGPRLQLMSQDELVDLQGNRSNAPFTEISAEKFTKQFNGHMEALCEKIPAFAATQNLFDLAIVAALIRRAQVEEKISFNPIVLSHPKALPHQNFSTPTQVPSLVNVKKSGRSLLMGLIGGGVAIVPADVISRTAKLSKPVPEVIHGSDTKPATWWWD